MKNIIAVVKESGKPAEVKTISTELKDLQEFVGGWVEAVEAPFGTDIDIIINEEGKFLDECKPNFFLPEYDDVAVGNALFVGFDINTGAFISLTDEQIEQVLEYLKQNTVGEEEINKEDYVRFEILYPFKF